MAARKSKTARSSARDGHAFAVVVEKMHGEFRVFGEALAGLTQTVTARFDDVNRRFDQVDRRFEQIDRRFEQVDQRFEQIDRRFDRVEHDLGLVKTSVLEHGRELKEIRATLDRKVDRDEVEGIVERVIARTAGG